MRKTPAYPPITIEAVQNLRAKDFSFRPLLVNGGLKRKREEKEEVGIVEGEEYDKDLVIPDDVYEDRAPEDIDDPGFIRYLPYHSE